MTRGLNQTFVWLLVCALGACDDDGGGDAEDAAPPDAGVPDACTQGCGEDAAPPDPDCTQDGDCIEGLYCDLPEGGFLGFCTAGCRADPEDDCGERRLCDVAAVFILRDVHDLRPRHVAARRDNNVAPASLLHAVECPHPRTAPVQA